jgi:hypothetical protein
MGEAARAHAGTLGWDAALAPLYRAYREVGTPAFQAAGRPTGSSAPAAGVTA